MDQQQISQMTGEQLDALTELTEYAAVGVAIGDAAADQDAYWMAQAEITARHNRTQREQL